MTAIKSNPYAELHAAQAAEKAAEHREHRESIAQRVKRTLGFEAPRVAPLDAEIRALLVTAVESDSPVSKAQESRLVELIALRRAPIKALEAAADSAAAELACGVTDGKALRSLVDGGAAKALIRVIAERKRLCDEFAKTKYAQELSRLREAWLKTHDAWKAAEEGDAPISPRVLTRLYEMYLAAMKAHSDKLNSQDDELVAHRAKLRLTGDPTLNDLDWRSFAI